MTERYSFRAENAATGRCSSTPSRSTTTCPRCTRTSSAPCTATPRRRSRRAHYQLDGPHRVVSTSGSHKHRFPAEHLYPSEALFRSGNTGPWDAPELDGSPPGVNPGGVKRWGIDNFQVFPNLEILVYERNWYLSYRFWPTSHNTHVFEADLWFVPGDDRPRAAGTRVRRHHGQGVRPAGRRHARRHPAGPRVPGVRRLPAERPGDPRPPLPQDRRRLGRRPRERVEVDGDGRCSRRSSPTSSRSRDVVPATEPERWERRLRQHRWTSCRRSTTPASLAPRRPSRTATGSTSTTCPPDAERLLQLLHSLALVSYAVEVWRQPLPIDTGSARDRPHPGAAAVSDIDDVDFFRSGGRPRRPVPVLRALAVAVRCSRSPTKASSWSPATTRRSPSTTTSRRSRRATR